MRFSDRILFNDSKPGTLIIDIFDLPTFYKCLNIKPSC